MKFYIRESKSKVKYIYYAISIVFFISIATLAVIQSQQIYQFRQEQIQRNNLISNELVEEPILDGLKPQIINIKGTKQTLYLPDKFKIDVLTEGLKSPQFIKSDDKGNLFVTDNKSNSLFIISAKNTKEPKKVDTKLDKIGGLDYYNNSIYLVVSNRVIQYTDIQSDGSYKEKKILIQDLPNPKSDLYNTIAIKNDRIYIGIPANCEFCQPKDKRLGSVLSYSMEGKDEKLFAKGIKQITDMKVDNNKLFITDIGRSGISKQLPKVEFNKLEEGRDYGWPYCYGISNVDPKYSEKEDFCKNKAESPISELPKDNGVSSFISIPSIFYKEFNDKYAFVYSGGSEKSIPKGYKIVIKDIKRGSASKNFITGWLLDDGSLWGIPKGIAFDNEGSMIITDQKNGLLYKITREQ